jgi:hypothetical protein
MALEALDYVNGIFSVILVIIFILVGLRIALRYRVMKESSYLFVGLCWVLMGESWYPSSISFIIALFNDGLGLIPFPEIYFILGTSLLPFALTFWLIAFTELMYKEKQKIVIIICVIGGILFETFLFYFLLTNPSVIGTVEVPVDANYGLFISVFQILLLIVLIITGTIFARASLKSDNPEHKLKGKLLLIAFWLFFIGAIFDVLSTLNFLFLILGRTMLFFSSVFFYYGFIFPEWMKNRFIKQKKTLN